MTTTNIQDLQNTIVSFLTDGEKVNPISDPLEAPIGLGEVSTKLLRRPLRH